MPAPEVLANQKNLLEDQTSPGEETWTRITLSDGIELSIRYPRGKEERQKITRLISLARSMFGKQNKREEK
ncbi:hypothetical protein EG834_22010 [bacterium]|nr:hypothetical protein [bacterium]